MTCNFTSSFSQNDLVNCKTSASKFNKVLAPITTQSCIFSIFQNDKTMVKQSWFIVYHTNRNIILLSKTSIIVYKIETLELMCNSSRHMVRGCNFCTMSVPCQCLVTAKDIYLPQRLSECQETSI